MAIARTATPGPWFDVYPCLTRSQADAFKARGMVGVFRYGPLPKNSTTSDLSREELAMLVDVGLEVGLVQHPRLPKYNELKSHSGVADAITVGRYAVSVGVPAGVHVFLDLEGVRDSSPAEVAEYCNDWATAIGQIGFRCGLYVGFDAVLNAEQLYALPGFDCYWADAGPRKVATRGFAVKQGFGVEAADGLPAYDPDTMAVDRLGGLPVIAVRAHTSAGRSPALSESTPVPSGEA
ncbi:MAG: DUF1906 domain-containing protein [Polyangiaceae bacterium]|nr:DUF1906 domain-containing protein [Polyangiaceae bacterium]